ncbi:MAG: hypothetical protein KBG84_13645 [Planctomycetes bacterium]|jgi:hypothetical protein|nr:hypothetical protein [Planctomycetota bacterium]
MSQVSNSDFNKKKSHLIRDAKQSKKNLTTAKGNRAEAVARKKSKPGK